MNVKMKINKKIIRLTIFIMLLAVLGATDFGLSSCNPHEHTLINIDSIEATCQQEGRVESWYCSDCKKYFLDLQCNIEVESITFPKTDHIYEAHNCKFCEVTEIDCFNISVINNEAVIIRIKKELPAKIIIPDLYVDNNVQYPITTIFDAVFDDEIFLTNITFPKHLVKIGDSAYFGCRMRQSIIVPDKVVSIGHTAFAGCVRLKKLNFKKVVILNHRAICLCILQEPF